MVKNNVQVQKAGVSKRRCLGGLRSRHIIEVWLSPGMLVNRVLHIDEALNLYDGTRRVGGRAQATDGNETYIGL